MSFSQDSPGEVHDLLVLVVDKDPNERKRLVQALDSLGIFGPKEVDDQFEALVATTTIPFDMVVYGLTIENGEPRFTGDMSMIMESVSSIVLTGPLNPALVEFLTPKAQKIGYPVVLGQEPVQSVAAPEFSSSRGMQVMKAAGLPVPTVEDLLGALERRELSLMYEPLVSPRTGEMPGVQVSLRWIHSEFGLQLPSALLEAATTEEAQENLALYLFERALEAQVRLRKEGLELDLHLNLGPAYLQQRGAANQLLSALLDYSGKAAPALVLDLEEASLLGDFKNVAANLSRMKSKGFTFALAGYSAEASPQQVRQLPLSFVKVNPARLMRGPQAERLPEIVGSCQALAAELKLTLVVQGVHRQAEWDFLGHLGCDLAYGRYISQPLEERAFLDWVEVRRKQESQPEPAEALNFLLFTYILAVTQDLGISWSRAIGLIKTHNPKAQPILDELERDLLQGKTLSSALRRYPDLFSAQMVEQVQGGEEFSRLPKVLRRLYEASLSKGLGSGSLEVSPLSISIALEDTADLMDTGVPLTKALRQAVTGCNSQAVRVGLQELLAQIESEGEDNLGSLHYPPQVFSRLAAPFMEVGQLTGRLPVALRDLAELLKAG